MSFVKKAVKKVFKVVKKVVKSKIFKIVAIAALIFFTAGVAAGGFAAFAGVNTVGGFMVAAGQTMATGAAAITGGLGMAGTSGALAAHGGAAATAAGLAGAPALGATLGTVASTTGVLAADVGVTSLSGIAASATSGVGAVTGTAVAATPAFSLAATPAASGGFLNAAANIFSKPILGDVTFGQLATSAVTTGLGTVLKSKMDEKDNPNGFVAGGLARGGGSDHKGLTGFEFGDPSGGRPDNTAIDAPVDTLAGDLARAPEEEEQAVPQAGDGIRGRLAERGLLGAPQEEQVAQGPQAPVAPGAPQPQAGLTNPDGSPAAFQDQATQIAYNPTTSIEDRLFGGLAGV